MKMSLWDILTVQILPLTHTEKFSFWKGYPISLFTQQCIVCENSHFCMIKINFLNQCGGKRSNVPDCQTEGHIKCPSLTDERQVHNISPNLAGINILNKLIWDGVSITSCPKIKASHSAPCYSPCNICLEFLAMLSFLNTRSITYSGRSPLQFHSLQTRLLLCAHLAALSPSAPGLAAQCHAPESGACSCAWHMASGRARACTREHQPPNSTLHIQAALRKSRLFLAVAHLCHIIQFRRIGKKRMGQARPFI